MSIRGVITKVMFAICGAIATVGAVFVCTGFAFITVSGWIAMRMED